MKHRIFAMWCKITLMGPILQGQKVWRFSFLLRLWTFAFLHEVTYPPSAGLIPTGIIMQPHSITAYSTQTRGKVQVKGFHLSPYHTSA